MVRESGLSVGNAGPVPPHQGEIPVAVKDVDAAIDALDLSVRELSARLGPVLADVCEQNEGQLDSIPKAANCELGGAISRHASIIRRITDDIDAFRRRLEL